MTINIPPYRISKILDDILYKLNRFHQHTFQHFAVFVLHDALAYGPYENVIF